MALGWCVNADRNNDRDRFKELMQLFASWSELMSKSHTPYHTLLRDRGSACVGNHLCALCIDPGGLLVNESLLCPALAVPHYMYLHTPDISNVRDIQLTDAAS